MDSANFKDFNREFVERLLARRPEYRARYDRLLEQEALRARATGQEEGVFGGPSAVEAVAETIVREERPVLFLKDDAFDIQNVTIDGLEARELVDALAARQDKLKILMPLIGRIDVANFPNNFEYVGTGWFVDGDIVVTNRHVASLIAAWDGRKYVFSRGSGDALIEGSFCTAHEDDETPAPEARSFPITEILYIEPKGGPNDIAFLRVRRRADGLTPTRIAIAPRDLAEDEKVVVVGYPAKAPRSVIPDQALMAELYRNRYDVKRAAPGLMMSTKNGVGRHDCTTLGGNSGSVVLDLDSGEAAGLHFAGVWRQENRIVRASVLNDYVAGKRWNAPPVVETGSGAGEKAPQPQILSAPTAADAARSATIMASVTIPLTITVSLGTPVVAAANAAAPPPSATSAEAALAAFWSEKPEGVVAARIGYAEEGDRFGDAPCIVASVPGQSLSAVEARGPARVQGVPVLYQPADVAEQIDARPELESVDSIAYDDDARTGAEFSFAEVDEEMTVRAHVGPEYSWDELKAFLSGVRGETVSAIYEFHGLLIAEAIEERLADGAKWTFVMDNASFSEVKDEAMEFDRAATFERWRKTFGADFQRIVAPEGRAGLISDAYHIKVTVRGDDCFWLSSGNWKQGSSQPVVTQQQRDDAVDEDLPGNREWHVVVTNKTLATRFRSHIAQDFARSTALGGGPLPIREAAEETFVDVPEEEAITLERRPPSAILAPREFTGRIKARPLLTPDREGEIYSEAVLALIRSARKSLLFQIPYISMRSNPRVDRGYIDALIDALAEKLKTLDDARLILRVGSKAFSSPVHTAWHLKSRGVDIVNRLRQIDNHHTKGMVVDGRRVLIGSHNWSKPGVTLNRDASLIFDNRDIAGYFSEAFEIDWERANPIKPKRFVREAVMLEAVGAAPPRGYRRVRLSELLSLDD